MLRIGRATPTYTAPRPAKQQRPSIYSPTPVIEPGSRGNHLPTGERPREALRPNIYPGATPQPGFAGRRPHGAGGYGTRYASPPPHGQNNRLPNNHTATRHRQPISRPRPAHTRLHPRHRLPIHQPHSIRAHTRLLSHHRQRNFSLRLTPPPHRRHSQNQHHQSPASTTPLHPIPRRQNQPPSATTIHHQHHSHASRTTTPAQDLRPADRSTRLPDTPSAERHRPPLPFIH